MSPIFGMAPGSRLILKNAHAVSQCPVPGCGQSAEIPQGSWEVVRELASVVLRHYPSDALDRVQRVVDAGATDEAVDQHFGDEPTAKGILKRLSTGERIAALAGALTLLGTVFGIGISHTDSAATTHAVEQNTAVLRKILHEIEMKSRPPLKPGRNDSCWCGSGNKFKRCHGR